MQLRYRTGARKKDAMHPFCILWVSFHDRQGTQHMCSVGTVKWCVSREISFILFLAQAGLNDHHHNVDDDVGQKTRGSHDETSLRCCVPWFDGKIAFLEGLCGRPGVRNIKKCIERMLLISQGTLGIRWVFFSSWFRIIDWMDPRETTGVRVFYDGFLRDGTTDSDCVFFFVWRIGRFSYLMIERIASVAKL